MAKKSYMYSMRLYQSEDGHERTPDDDLIDFLENMKAPDNHTGREWNFREIASHAILANLNFTPEMYRRDNTPVSRSDMELMLSDVVSNLLTALPEALQEYGYVMGKPSDDGTITPFSDSEQTEVSRNLASFMNRRRQQKRGES